VPLPLRLRRPRRAVPLLHRLLPGASDRSRDDDVVSLDPRPRLPRRRGARREGRRGAGAGAGAARIEPAPGGAVPRLRIARAALELDPGALVAVDPAADRLQLLPAPAGTRDVAG